MLAINDYYSVKINKKLTNLKNKIFKLLKEALLFLLVMTIFANILSMYRSSDLNKETINISSVTLLNDELYLMQKDKPLLIHFWATWCPTCKVEAPNIERISKSYNVLTIATKSGSNSEIEEYLNSRNLTFNVVNDKDGEIAKKFNVAVFPTTIIYNKNGIATFSNVGYTSTFGLWLRMWWADKKE